jgi:hypothetical protein
MLQTPALFFLARAVALLFNCFGPDLDGISSKDELAEELFRP